MIVHLEIHYLRDFQGQREIQRVEVDGDTIGVHQLDTHLLQINGTREGNRVREDRIAIVKNDSLGVPLDQDFGQTLQIRIIRFVLHRMKVVDGQQEITVARGVDQGFRSEGVGVFDRVKGFHETQMGP